MIKITNAELSEIFNITPSKLTGDRALSRAVGRINKRFMYMSMEDLEFIAETIADALKVELDSARKDTRA